MYQKLSGGDGAVLGYEVREVLTAEQLDEILTEVEEAIADHGSVRLLVSMPSVPYPDPTALGDDLGFWLRHSDDVERYAVVGESPLLEWAARVVDLVSSTEVEYFEHAALEDAWGWLESGRDDGE